MHSLLQRLERLEGHIRRLAEKLEESRNECTALEQENDRLKKALAECRSSFQTSREVSGGQNGQSGKRSVEIKHIKSKIDRYISEIDHCVEQLNEIKEL